MRITKFMHKFTEEEKENIEFRQVYFTKLSIWLLFLGIPQKKNCVYKKKAVPLQSILSA